MVKLCDINREQVGVLGAPALGLGTSAVLTGMLTDAAVSFNLHPLQPGQRSRPGRSSRAGGGPLQTPVGTDTVTAGTVTKEPVTRGKATTGRVTKGPLHALVGKDVQIQVRFSSATIYSISFSD